MELDDEAMTNPTPLPPEGVTLKPCPFCGGKELGLNRPSDHRTGPHWHDWFIRCYGCHVETSEYRTEVEAITAWNHRIAATSAEAMVRYFHQAADAQEALTKAEAKIARLMEAVANLLPTKLCGESWNLPDNESVTIVTTFGKLAALRQALDQGAEG